MTRSFRYLGYPASATEPNVVVDGSPNDSTVLTLTHWPGFPQPDGFHFDLSAEMTFHYLDAPIDAGAADVVTNNHFDQDGLVGLHALVNPELSQEHRQLLIDAARAGDFATFRDRRAARASMIINAYADAGRSPIADRLVGSYDEQCVVLYEETIPLLVSMAVDGERFHNLWAEEDEQLTASEKAIANDVITVEELPDIDLAVVTIPDSEITRSGHRFAGESFEGVHPMALHNATNCFRLLVVHGRRYQYVDRYETWVQYRSRRPLPRVDMRPLAERLIECERSSAMWSASRPGSLTPTLRVDAESSLDSDVVRGMVIAHLRDSPPAWDPYSSGDS
ncbi:MAG: hypothetical protein JJD93_13175 [Ilumatobacteraceae bacterium]|nr:hypothetical protein [Ilumatobacteraceae bacterium]